MRASIAATIYALLISVPLCFCVVLTEKYPEVIFEKNPKINEIEAAALVFIDDNVVNN